ncbi:hypothetical protein [Cryptosporangium minutisporangium]|uniref:hypothetical protein n=1 Tax=Cryptosporangium minutisporangium TaxID=113569 RepID=UPI0031EBE350
MPQDAAERQLACADGSVTVVGDLSAIERLLRAVTDPWPADDAVERRAEVVGPQSS